MAKNSRDKMIRNDVAAEGRDGSFWFGLARGVLRRTLIRSHPRLYLAGATGVLLYLLLSGWSGPTARFLIAFDGGALAFLVAVWIMMATATQDDMRRRAQLEDEGRYTVLCLGSMAAVAVLLAIAVELHGSKNASSPGPHIAVAAATILLSWFFMNTIFALHYAHGYFGDADPTVEYQPAGGLHFPGEGLPDYWDFMYFAFCIGMTFQVSDVEIEDREIRRVALAHSVLAFFFNVVVLALTINIVAGLM